MKGTTIHISNELRDELRRRGIKGDTYEGIIWNLIYEVKRKKKK